MKSICPLLTIAALSLAGCVTEPTPVTVTFCPGQVADGTLFIRNDDGGLLSNGQWREVDSPDGNSFSFTPPRRLSLALIQNVSPIVRSLRVFQLAADEMSQLNCLTSTTGPTRTYTGTISGLTTGKSAQIWLGTGVTRRGNGAYSLQSVATGASDLVALMLNGPSVVEKMVVRRGLNLASGAVLNPIDFAGAEAVAPRTSTVFITGAGSDRVSPFYGVLTNGTSAGLPAVDSSGTMTIASLPAELQLPTDSYVLGASAIVSTGAYTSGRRVSVHFRTPLDRPIAFGPALATSTMSFAGSTGPTTLRFTLPVQSEYAERADLTIDQGDTLLLDVTITMTRAYRGRASSWNFETPDPSMLHVPAVQLDPGAFTGWLISAASGDLSSLFTGTAPDELTVREAYADGAVGAGIKTSRITNIHSELPCLLCSRKRPF